METLSTVSLLTQQMIVPVPFHLFYPIVSACQRSGLFWSKQAQKLCRLMMGPEGKRCFCVIAVYCFREAARKSNSIWFYVRTGFTSGSCFGTASSTVSSMKSLGWVTEESSLPNASEARSDSRIFFVILILLPNFKSVNHSSLHAVPAVYHLKIAGLWSSNCGAGNYPGSIEVLQKDPSTEK